MKKSWLECGDEARLKFVAGDVWKGLVSHWLNPKTKDKSEKCRDSRMSKAPETGQVSKHCSGQYSFEYRAEMITLEKGEPATMPEVWEKTHQRKDGTWIDHRVEKAHSDVLTRCNELTSQVTPEGTQVTVTPADINRFAAQVVPRNRRGKPIFIGSIPTDHFGAPVTSISYGPDPATTKKLKELQEENELYDGMFEVLAATNPQIKKMLEAKRAKKLAQTGP